MDGDRSEGSESHAENATRGKSLRADLVIATFALLISLAATAASWWQSRVVAQQLSAQVWPYVSIDISHSPTAVAIDIVNDGLGPALIRSTVITLDGKPVADPTVVLRALIPHRVHRRLDLDLNDLGPGTVIRSSSSIRFLRIDGAWAAQPFSRGLNRLDLRICYCSLLANCWLSTYQGQDEPTPLPQCPRVGGARFQLPPSMTMSGR